MINASATVWNRADTETEYLEHRLRSKRWHIWKLLPAIARDQEALLDDRHMPDIGPLLFNGLREHLRDQYPR